VVLRLVPDKSDQIGWQIALARIAWPTSRDEIVQILVRATVRVSVEVVNAR
jgi:hypothetical protein